MNETVEKEFLSLLEQHLSLLVKIVRVYAYNTQNQKDLMSDIVFELWKSYPSFKGNSKVSTWFYRVALNISLKTKRKRDNNKLLFIEELITFDTNIFDSTPDDRSAIHLLYKCIEELNPINKAIILLYLENKTNGEIAEITGFSLTNVSTRLSRIREELRKCMIKKEQYGY